MKMVKDAKKRKINLQSELNKHYSGTQELVDSEVGLARYNLHVVKELAASLGIDKNVTNIDKTIVEFGAGTGALADVWRSEFGIDPVCVEIDASLIEILRSKGYEVFSNINELPYNVSLIYTSNVLEHIEDDVLALKLLRQKMVVGGKIAIYVPALPFLFSDLDRNVGHFRRYMKKELINKVEISGFKVNKCFYNDSVGILASLAVKLAGYKNGTGIGTKTSFMIYDSCVYPISRILDKILMRRVIGKNIFLFAENP